MEKIFRNFGPVPDLQGEEFNKIRGPFVQPERKKILACPAETEQKNDSKNQAVNGQAIKPESPADKHPRRSIFEETIKKQKYDKKLFLKPATAKVLAECPDGTEQSKRETAYNKLTYRQLPKVTAGENKKFTNQENQLAVQSEHALKQEMGKFSIYPKRLQSKSYPPRNQVPEPKIYKKKPWYHSMTTGERLYYHQTLSGMRRTVYVQTPMAPQDSLDFLLNSVYEHGDADPFPPSMDCVAQPETYGFETWRVLRNTYEVHPEKQKFCGHPVLFGGLTERRCIHNVRLGIIAPHFAQTNAGYSRKINGSFYPL